MIYNKDEGQNSMEGRVTRRPPRFDMSMSQIITWMASIIVTAVAVTVFAFSNFQTKSEAQKSEIYLDKRLERIESSLDDILKIMRHNNR